MTYDIWNDEQRMAFKTGEELKIKSLILFIIYINIL